MKQIYITIFGSSNCGKTYLIKVLNNYKFDNILNYKSRIELYTDSYELIYKKTSTGLKVVSFYNRIDFKEIKIRDKIMMNNQLTVLMDTNNIIEDIVENVVNVIKNGYHKINYCINVIDGIKMSESIEENFVMLNDNINFLIVISKIDLISNKEYLILLEGLKKLLEKTGKDILILDDIETTNNFIIDNRYKNSIPIMPISNKDYTNIDNLHYFINNI